MYCPNCGTRVEDGSEFCSSCGGKISGNKNNMRRTIVVLSFVLLVSLVLGSVILKQVLVNREMNVNALCSMYTEKYEVISKKENGSCEIKVSAPDFVSIVLDMQKNNVRPSVSAIQKKAKENQSRTREYIFTVSQESSEEINEKFAEQVSYDLMIAAIKSTKYNEGDGLAK